MEFLHALQPPVIHRDLKPANILLKRMEDGSHVAKVADFGLAKVVDSSDRLTQSGVAMGTPAYMAPEQIRQTKDVGPAADVFSLGSLSVIDLKNREPQVLVLSPTRELAEQSAKVIMCLGDYMNVACHVCIGGQKMSDDIRMLQYGQHIVIYDNMQIRL